MDDLARVKRLVSYYKRKCGTDDPFEIADQLGVLYQIGNCKHEGCYMFLKNHRYIFLSNQLDREELRLVMAHELGHALLDRKANCYFIRNKTLLLVSKLERRANLFAAHLLISEKLLTQYRGYTEEQFCQCTGYPKELLELRLK
nr:MAG TPA: IrrE protein [Caudoviricetes sp.]